MTDIAALFQDQPLIEDQQQDAAPEPEQHQEAEAPFSLENHQPEPEAQPEPQQPKHVPLSALQEERSRRQEYQQELERERQRAAQMEQRFQQMVERMQAAQQPVQQEEPIPAFEEDPAAHIAAVTRKYEAEMAELRQFKDQQIQVSQQQAQQYEVVQRAIVSENAMRASTPDYAQVTDAYTARRMAEYQALGLPPQEAQAIMQRDVFNLSAFALQRGMDPAKAFYDMARAAMPQGTPTAPAPAQQAPRAPNGQFQKAPVATSLSNVSGAPNQPDEGGTLTLEKIAGLSDADFDRLWKQMERGQTVMPKV